MNDPQAHIIVFARAPVPGACKSRLAAGIGDRRATRVYRRMLAHTVAMACDSVLANVSLWCAPASGYHTFLRLRATHGAVLVTQPDGDLGGRMHRALEQTLRTADRAVLVGTDCPALGRRHLAEALQRLAAGDDAVFGPTRDGGYALVGLRAPEARLFRGPGWGDDNVMASTRRRLERLGMRWSELSPLADVDDRRDYLQARRAGLI